MNLLNTGDLTNALSQQCWQEDQSHLLSPSASTGVRAACLQGAAAPTLVTAQAEAARGGKDGAGPYVGSSSLTCLWDCGVKHWSGAATSG